MTVVVKRHDDCALEHFVTYQASSAFDLPSAFDDGQTSLGASVTLDELTVGAHVRITLRYAGTAVDIRQAGAFLSVLIAVPDAVLNETRRRGGSAGAAPLQLCAGRCPRRLRVDVAKFLAGETDSRVTPADVQSAVTSCRARGLVDGYLDSCVYDLVSSGERHLVSLAGLACDDAVRLRLTRRNRTTLAAAAASVTSVTVRLCCSAACLHTALLVLLLTRICQILR